MRVYQPSTTGALLPGSWFVGALCLSFAALALMLAMERISVGPFVPGDATIGVGAAAFIATYLAARRGEADWQRRARDFSQFAGMFLAAALFGAIATYPIVAASHGLADARLEAIDRRLGFDWIGWYELVAAHPLLQWTGRIAYQSIFVTPALIFGYFALNGRRADAQRLVASFWLAVLLTLVLFSAMPAEGPLAFLWRGPIPYMPVSALYQAQLIPALRDHVLSRVDPEALRGLVCAPSFHATSAVLYIAAAWRCGWLRWPLIGISCAMLLATPVEGTHYLIDLIGGVLVALVALSGHAALSAFFGSRGALPARVRRLAVD